MLRLLIGTGVLLMAVGFGAAGWQYWQGLPSTAMPGPEARSAPEGQVWMSSPAGSVVPETDSRAFLVQDRLIPDRMARILVTASLDDLLLEGEKLPALPFREVLADIRAPRLADALCPILAADLAMVCSVHAARVVPGSLDSIRNEARFTLDLAIRPAAAGAELPDLAAHVLRTETVRPPSGELPVPASAAAALAALATATAAACQPEDRAATCRVLGITLDWAPGGPVQSAARIGWLGPLPQGMTILTPVAPLPEG
jgi:hypothetical protein